MANLWSGIITNKDEWKKFTNISGKSLTDDTKYSIQVRGACWLCDKATEPADREGFLREISKPFGFTKKSGSDLWVRAASNFCEITIAD